MCSTSSANTTTASPYADVLIRSLQMHCRESFYQIIEKKYDEVGDRVKADAQHQRVDVRNPNVQAEVEKTTLKLFQEELNQIVRSPSEAVIGGVVDDVKKKVRQQIERWPEEAVMALTRQCFREKNQILKFQPTQCVVPFKEWVRLVLQICAHRFLGSPLMFDKFLSAPKRIQNRSDALDIVQQCVCESIYYMVPLDEVTRVPLGHESAVSFGPGGPGPSHMPGGGLEQQQQSAEWKAKLERAQREQDQDRKQQQQVAEQMRILQEYVGKMSASHDHVLQELNRKSEQLNGLHSELKRTQENEQHLEQALEEQGYRLTSIQQKERAQAKAQAQAQRAQAHQDYNYYQHQQQPTQHDARASTREHRRPRTRSPPEEEYEAEEFSEPEDEGDVHEPEHRRDDRDHHHQQQHREEDHQSRPATVHAHAHAQFSAPQQQPALPPVDHHLQAPPSMPMNMPAIPSMSAEPGAPLAAAAAAAAASSHLAQKTHWLDQAPVPSRQQHISMNMNMDDGAAQSLSALAGLQQTVGMPGEESGLAVKPTKPVQSI